MLARHVDAGVPVIMIEHRAIMLYDYAILFFKRRIGQTRSVRQPRHDLTDQPGTTIGAAADHHAIRAALLQSCVGILDRTDIPIDDDGQLHRILHLAHKGPVGRPLVHLVTGAAVHGDQFCAQILGDMRQFGRIEAGMIPAHPHLDGDGHVHRLYRRLDQRGGERQVAHQRAAGVAIDDLLDRAAHVDVDNGCAAIGIEPGGIGHLPGRTAGQLH